MNKIKAFPKNNHPLNNKEDQINKEFDEFPEDEKDPLFDDLDDWADEECYDEEGIFNDEYDDMNFF